MSKFNKLLSILTSYQRKQAGWLLAMLIMVAFLDMIGVASILPFIAILTNPDLIETNSILNSIYQTSSIFGVDSHKQFFLSTLLLKVLFLQKTTPLVHYL